MSESISTQDFCFKETEIPLNGTIYQKKELTPKAAILYFHGGGLLCGNRHDLPSLHIETLCNAGYVIIAFDYRLAPATKIPQIMEDVMDGIRWFLSERSRLFHQSLPYFLWGRSSGAFLTLLACRRICLDSDLTGKLEEPRGILSYYGYAFLENHWYNTPNDYYLSLVKINPKVIPKFRDEVCADKPIESRFILYMYVRQQGSWISELFDEKEKYFYAPYSFRLIDDFSKFPPVFITHASGDPDVPFAEAQDLVSKLPDTCVYYVSKKQHDFDRDTDDPATITLLKKTVEFLNRFD